MPWASARQAHEVPILLRGREDRPRCDAHPLGAGQLRQPQAVHLRCQFHPHHETAGRLGDARAGREMPRHRLDHPAHGAGIVTADGAQVALVAAAVQHVSQRQLRHRRAGHVQHVLEVLHPRLVAPRHQPAHAQPRRQGLGERRAVQHLGAGALAERQTRRRPARAEAEVAVDVVLDQRHATGAEQRQQAPLARLGHAVPERVAEVRRGDAGAHRPALQRQLQRLQRQAVHRVGGNLQRLQLQGIERLQQAVERGRLDGHHVPRSRHGAQRQHQRFLAAVGDDHIIGAGGAAVGGHAARNLPPQFRQPGWKRVRRRPVAVLAGGAGERPFHRPYRQEARVRYGSAELHHRRIVAGLDQAQHEFLPGYRARLGGRRRARRRRYRFGGAVADVVTGARSRLDQHIVFQAAIGGQHGRYTDPTCTAQRAHAGQSFAGAIHPGHDAFPQLAGETIIQWVHAASSTASGQGDRYSIR